MFDPAQAGDYGLTEEEEEMLRLLEEDIGDMLESGNTVIKDPSILSNSGQKFWEKVTTEIMPELFDPRLMTHIALITGSEIDLISVKDAVNSFKVTALTQNGRPRLEYKGQQYDVEIEGQTETGTVKEAILRSIIRETLLNEKLTNTKQSIEKTLLREFIFLAAYK